MKAKLTATVFAVAVALGISSCAAPAPSMPAAAPAASAAAAQLPQTGGRVQPAAPDAIPTVEAPAPQAPAGPDYKSVYKKLLGGNVGDFSMVVLTSSAKRGNFTLPAGSFCMISYGGTVESLSPMEYKYTYPFAPADIYCPSGITFRMQSGNFDFKSNASLAAKTDSKLKEQLDLYGVDSDNFGPGIPGQLPNYAGLVRVMNLAPISNTDKTYAFWTQCTLRDHDNNTFTGKIELVGKSAIGTTFARYTSSSPRRGGECPSGTIYIQENPAMDGLPQLQYDYWIEFK